MTNTSEQFYLEMRALEFAYRYAEIVEKCTPLAEQGDPFAQYFLAECYGHGDGVKWDAGTAKQWYERALQGLTVLAEQGNARANYLIGYCHRHGKSVPYDNHEAMKWYAKAMALYEPLAEAGDAEAQYMLGCCYHFEEGVKPPDKEKAAVLWEKAAMQGHPLAQLWIANCYNFGLVCGVKQDFEKAFGWYRAAAAQGVVKAMGDLASYYYFGCGVEKSYETAKEWYEKAFACGYSDTDSMYLFAACLLKVEEQDVPRAVEYLERAAWRGDSDSRELLEKLADAGVEEAEAALDRLDDD